MKDEKEKVGRLLGSISKMMDEVNNTGEYLIDIDPISRSAMIFNKKSGRAVSLTEIVTLVCDVRRNETGGLE